MTNYKVILPIVFSIFLAAFVSCSGGKSSATETVEEENLPEDIVELRDDQIKLAGIETGAIELHPMSGTLKVSGTVESAPQNLASVSMPMGGFVKSTTLLPGNSVTKGQTLAIIENQEFIDLQQNYLEAKSRFEYAEADYNRQAELHKSEVSSAKNLQLVTSEYKSLKVQVKALAQKLNLIGIDPARLTDDNISRSVALISPITGYIKTANVSIGKSVSSSDVLFEIVNLNDLFLQLTLFEKDANKVLVRQKVRFFAGNNEAQYEAVVYQTAKSIDSDKTYKVFAKVNSKTENVLPGMYVNALIETSGNRVTALPNEAIVSFDEKDYIFVFEREKDEDGKPFTEYRMIEIEKGVTDGGYTEVSLPEGFDYKEAKVVVKGAYNLLSAKKNAGEMAC